MVHELRLCIVHIQKMIGKGTKKGSGVTGLLVKCVKVNEIEEQTM